jgi:flagellin-specific chaperone FliS
MILDPNLANTAIENDHLIYEALTILKERHKRQNHEQGSELVDNLIPPLRMVAPRVFAAGEQNGNKRLDHVRMQMGDLRRAWDFVLLEGEGMSQSPGPRIEFHLDRASVPADQSDNSAVSLGEAMVVQE